MDEQPETNAPAKKLPTGTPWIVFGSIGYAWALVMLFRTLTLTDSSEAAGGYVGMLIVVGIATLLLVTGLNIRKRNVSR